LNLNTFAPCRTEIFPILLIYSSPSYSYLRTFSFCFTETILSFISLGIFKANSFIFWLLSFCFFVCTFYLFTDLFCLSSFFMTLAFLKCWFLVVQNFFWQYISPMVTRMAVSCCCYPTSTILFFFLQRSWSTDVPLLCLRVSEGMYCSKCLIYHFVLKPKVTFVSSLGLL
jgi:hypothetical protein